MCVCVYIYTYETYLNSQVRSFPPLDVHLELSILGSSCKMRRQDVFTYNAHQIGKSSNKTSSIIEMTKCLRLSRFPWKLSRQRPCMQ